MNQLYVLQVASTGETFYTGTTDLSIVRWWRINEHRLLRLKRTPQAFKDAVAANDTIVGWVNYDELRRADLTYKQKAAEVSRVFHNFDKYYEKRLLTK